MKEDDALWLGLTAWSMTVLALCATASPGEGFVGLALALLPPDVHVWLHAPAAGLLAWLVLRGLERHGWAMSGSLASSAMLSLLFAGILEWPHPWQGARSPVMIHLGWAAIGIVLAWLFWVLRSRRVVRAALPATVIPFRRTTGRVRKGSLQ